MINYFYDCYSILNKVYSDKTFIKQAILDTVIEEKNRSLTIKTCYGVLDKDIELSYYIKNLAEKSPKLVIRTILKIAMYNIKYLEKKDYAVVKNAVELTKKLGKGGMAGFVNAFLRKFIEKEISLPKDTENFLSVKYSYPLFAVKELLKSFGKERTEKIISAENKKTTICFYAVNGEEYLTQKGVSFTKTPFENVFSAVGFVRDEGFDEGKYTFQALGSVAICEVIDKCESLLDCCSAPGGKSVRLSYKIDNVVAFDVHEHRVALIESYAKRMKRNNITWQVQDSKVFDETLVSKFDAVLVDAPCSGLGVLNDNPDIKLNREENDIESLNKEQLAILKNVSKYVKCGGNLYYSTCSVLDRENCDIVKSFLNQNKNFIIEQISSPLSCENRGGGLAFLPDISQGLGFYVCKMKKIKG